MNLPTPPPSAAESWAAALHDSDRRRAAGALQIQAWELLGAYLNGGLGRGGLWYPLARTEAPLLRRRANLLADCWRQFGDCFGAPGLPEAGRDTAAILAAHYGRFAAELPLLTAADLDRVDVDPAHHYPDRPWQRHVPRPATGTRHLQSFWLHGSSGDGHWKEGWSDVDTLAIVATDALRDSRRLRDLRHDLIATRRVLLHEQPLQLHGHFVLAEPDLVSMPVPMFPAVLFGEARTVCAGDTPFTVAQREDRALATRTLWIHGIHDLVAQAGRPVTSDLARVFLLHRIYLLPSLYAQAMGQAVPKRVSFAQLPDLMPPWSVDFFQRAATVWRHWTPPPAWHGVLRAAARPLSFNPFLYQRALRMLTARTAFFRTAPDGGWHALAHEAGDVAARLWQELPSREVDHVDR